MPGLILFVVTSHQTMGPWLEELAASYMLVRSEGFETLIASPDGGTAVLDPASVAAPWLTSIGEAFLNDDVAVAQLRQTVALDTVDADNVAAIYLVGGTGTMWDFPGCRPLGALISKLAGDGKPIAAICHGVSGLLAATTPNGTPLVKDRRLTCFSDAEETIMEMQDVVPILAETALRSQGAIYSCTEPFGSHVVIDGQLLTGQNPASTPELGESLIRALT